MDIDHLHFLEDSLVVVEHAIQNAINLEDKRQANYFRGIRRGLEMAKENIILCLELEGHAMKIQNYLVTDKPGQS